MGEPKGLRSSIAEYRMIVLSGALPEIVSLLLSVSFAPFSEKEILTMLRVNNSAVTSMSAVRKKLIKRKYFKGKSSISNSLYDCRIPVNKKKGVSGYVGKC
jgi:hypothetical protein